LVELYQDRLVARGAIGPHLDTRLWTEEEVDQELEPLQRATGAALERFEDDFFAALQAARDLTGLLLARCVQRLDPDDLDFATVAARFCEALVELGQAHLLAAFVDNFVYRGIDPRPLFPGAPPVRGPLPLGRAMADPQAVAAVGRLIQHPHREAVALAGG
jgi:hypothetical protein